MNQNHLNSPTSHHEELTLSLHLHIPHWRQFRVALFAREYPYLALMAVSIGALILLLFSDGLVWLWHSTHHQQYLTAKRIAQEQNDNDNGRKLIGKSQIGPQ